MMGESFEGNHFLMGGRARLDDQDCGDAAPHFSRQKKTDKNSPRQGRGSTATERRCSARNFLVDANPNPIQLGYKGAFRQTLSGLLTRRHHRGRRIWRFSFAGCKPSAAERRSGETGKNDLVDPQLRPQRIDPAKRSRTKELPQRRGN